MPLTILVTGATPGFGAAMARRFVGDGHRVIAAARRTDLSTASRAEPDAALLPTTRASAVHAGMVPLSAERIAEAA